MSASSKTTTGALPPSSRWVRLRSAAAAAATSMPARTEPVIETSCGVGWRPARGRCRGRRTTTLSTPGGRNSAAISASIIVVTGVVSDGLSTTVLPAASAGASFQTAIISG